MPVSEPASAPRGWLRPLIAGSCITVTALTAALLLLPKAANAPKTALPPSDESVARTARERVTTRSIVPARAAMPSEPSNAAPVPRNRTMPVDSGAAFDAEATFSAFRSAAEAEAKWAAESPDDEWTENAGTFVSALLETVDCDLSSLQKVECRSTVCRIELGLDDRAGLYRLSDELRRDKYPLTYRQVAGSDGDASEPVLHVYIGREFTSRTAH